MDNCFALDIETTDLTGEVILGFVAYNDDFQKALEWTDESSSWLVDLIESGMIPVFHNASFDVPILRDFGIPIKDFHDTQILAYVHNPSHDSYSLDNVAHRYAGVSKLPKPKSWERWDTEMQRYCLQDGAATWAAFKSLVKFLRQDKRAWELYEKVERPYVELIIEMETNGCLVDVSKLDELIADLTAKEEMLRLSLEQSAGFIPGDERLFSKQTQLSGSMAWMPVQYKVPMETLIPDGATIIKTNAVTYVYSVDEWVFIQDGKEHPTVGYHKSKEAIRYDHCELDAFNPNSTAHIIHLLSSKYGWEPDKFTESGIAATDDEVLSSLPYPLAKSLTEYREVAKLLTSFLLKIKLALDEYDVARTGFNQTSTKSGRLSSSGAYNFQNIPAHGTHGSAIRSLFTAPPGWAFCSCDLSNIEGRILAHYLAKSCGDTAMADIFNSGQDFHTLNALNWGLVERMNPGQGAKLRELYLTGVITKDDPRIAFARKVAKIALYACVYGAGALKIGVTCGKDKAFGVAILDTIKESAPALFDLKEKVWQYLEQHDGVIHTLHGRRLVYDNFVPSKCEANARALKEKPKWADKPIKYLMRMLRSMDERSSFNGLLQGSAADINKLWSLEALPLIHTAGGVLNMTVHDELDFTLPESVADVVVPAVAATAGKLSTQFVAVTADGKWGRNWGETH